MMYLTPSQRTQAIDFFVKTLKYKGKFMHHPKYGICKNLEYSMFSSHGTGYHIVAGSCETWEHFSGCTMYPIPDSKPRCGLWDGEQLSYRLSLCRHILSELESNK